MKAYTKDIIKTIVKGMKRFMALALIAALGVCMMTGLKAACGDLRYTADEFFDKQNLFDIMIVSTHGLTDDDIEVLKHIPGIDAIEGAFSETVHTKVDGQTKQASVKVLSDVGINEPYLLDGEMPMRADEILVTQKYLNETGAKLGDIISFEEVFEEEEDDEEEEEDSEDDDSPFDLDLETKYEKDESEDKEDDYAVDVEEEEEEPNFLVTDYVITGVVIDAEDINSSEGAVAFRNNSNTDYTFFVLSEAVDTDVYTAIYITLTGTDELRCYSDEYVSRVDEIVSILEQEIKADREQARYEVITGEAYEKVEDAEAEVDEKLSEAEKDIFDAKFDIEDGWSELLDGEWDILDGEEELRAAERELNAAERELAAAKKELDEAKAEIEAGEEAIEQGETTIADGKKEIASGRDEIQQAREDIPDQFASMKLLLRGQIASTNMSIRQIDSDILVAEAELERIKLKPDSAEKQAEIEAKEKEIADLKDQKKGLEESSAELQKTYDGLDEDEQEAYAELDKAEAELDDAEKELKDAEVELEKSKAELEDGRKEYEEGLADYEEARQEVDDGWKELEEGYEEYYDGLRDYEKGKAELEDGIKEYEEGVTKFEDKKAEALEKLEEARQEIADLKMTEWYISTRTALSGYSNVKTDAECIESIGNAFPILFLTVAILISLTTISRMVEEDRGLIGTYKALGFTDKEIRRKYVVYSLLACLVGGVLGIILGFVVLPQILFTVFDVMYQIPEYGIFFNWLYGIGGIVLFVIAIVGSAIVSCSSELSITPATLMRPKAPKNGSRVLLERVTPVWSRLSFLNKVTARNLFRYKKRLFMTLFGIAGCTSILLAGFTIRDTVINLIPLQYEDTYCYDAMLVSDDNEKLLEYLEDKGVRAYINPMISSIKIINEDGREEMVQLNVIPNDQSLRGYINLKDRDGNKIYLEDGMILSTINVAEVQGYDKGDTITIQNMSLENVEVEVSEIIMNYLGNSIYMTENTYKELYDDYEPNGAYVMLDKSVSDHEAYVEALSEKDGILSVGSVEGFMEDSDTVFRIINLVVTIVITLAAALAFVVLFTLSTTNISERERELATIKVLGFFDGEVHAYVNKETLILTSIGILLGLPMGKAFGVWLMSILKMPSIYFADYLAPISYLYAAVIAIIFAFIVNKITDKSLDKIDPVEALKSIE